MISALCVKISRGDNMGIKLLMADDNKDIIEIMKPHFVKEKYQVDFAYDGQMALDMIAENNYDIVLLDIMMPKVDGFSVCKQVRQTSQVPIIMITAKTEDEDVIMGLDIGADDYIVKPFSPKQVIAKIKALMRRIKLDSVNEIINLSNLSINMEEYVVKIDDEVVNLTKKEIEIIYLLAKHPSRVYSREMLLNLIWGEDYFGELRTVDTHIKRLRFKLADKKKDWDIKTVWGVGYKFEENKK